MASGDLKYEDEADGTLSPAQRTALANLIAGLWPGALTDLNLVTFYRAHTGGIGYSLKGEQTKAPRDVPLGCRITGRVP